jgi:biopolymer transport protein ExbD
MRSSAARGALALCLVAASCSSSSKPVGEEAIGRGRHTDPERAMTACVDAVAASASVEPSTRLASVADACKHLYVEKACRDAWDRGMAGPVAERMTIVARGCRDAYCPLLAEPRPGLCAAADTPGAADGSPSPMQGWGELQLAILTLDLGRERAERLAVDMQRAIDAMTAPIGEMRLDGPAAGAPATNDRAAPCGQEIAMALGADGAWMGASTGERRFAASCGGAADAQAIQQELRRLRGLEGLTCASGLSLSADSSVTYQSVVLAMDAAISAGLRDVGFVDQASLPISFPAKPGKAERLTAQCSKSAQSSAPASAPTRSQPASTPPSGGPAADGPAVPVAGSQDVAKQPPVVIVTRTAISLDGQRLATLADVAAAKDSTIPGLEAALKERSARIEAEIRAGTRDEKLRGILILQADRDTSAGIVNRIIKVAYGAGFPDVMFAVNRQGR